jgi:hypothetical protein
MQHYDHATNQPHNPATTCNNKTHATQRKKKNLPSQICKMQHHHTTNHASQTKTQHTKSCNPKGRKEKFMNFTTTNNAKPKGKQKQKPTS